MKKLEQIIIQRINAFKSGMLLVILLFSSLSCSDILKEEVVSSIGNEYLNTPQGFNDGVNAAYSSLRTFYGQEISMTMSQLGTDTYTHGADGSFKKYNLYTSDLDPYDSYINTLWREFYKGINTCNAILDRGANIEGINPTLLKTRMAEVKALRAHFYFVLVQHYGGLDLRLTETLGPTTALTRNSEEEVYKQIIADYEAALINLPANSSDWGRYTKMGVEAMLCKVYITRATRPFGTAADFKKSEEYGKNVINNYDRKLLADYAKIYELGNDVNSEAVFSVQFSYDLLSSGGSDFGNRWHLYYLMEYDLLPGVTRVTEQGRPWKRLRPTDYTYNKVMVNRDKDSRYDKSFQKVFYATRTGTFVANLDDSKTQITLAVGDTAAYLPGYEMSKEERAKRPYQVIVPSRYSEKVFSSLKKFLDPKRASVNEARGGRDFYVVRLADVYLLVAEALIKQGKAAEAVNYINPVRKRAAYPTHETEMEITADQATMEFVYDERARELLGEGHRWTDLKRWGKLIERVKAYNPQANEIKEHHNYRPVPQSQIDLTDGGKDAFPQNPGY